MSGSEEPLPSPPGPTLAAMQLTRTITAQRTGSTTFSTWSPVTVSPRMTVSAQAVRAATAL